MNHNFHKIITPDTLKSKFLIGKEWKWITDEFRDVPDYEGFYQVSTFGRVKSLARKVVHLETMLYRKERILKANLNYNYLKVVLYKNGKPKTFTIHALISMAFLGHKPDGTNRYVVDHKDYNKLNNHVSNLQIITNRENNSKDQFRHNRSSKYVGVSRGKFANKWSAQIWYNGKKRHLGYFVNELDAHNAYQESKEELEESILVK